MFGIVKLPCIVVLHNRSGTETQSGLGLICCGFSAKWVYDWSLLFGTIWEEAMAQPKKPVSDRQKNPPSRPPGKAGTKDDSIKDEELGHVTGGSARTLARTSPLS